MRPLAPLLIAIALVAVRPSAAAADDAVAADARHRFGVQLGGSAGFQLLYRVRVVGPVHVEAGVFAGPHAGNGSAGVVVEIPLTQRWALYASGGVGGALATGETPVQGCDPLETDCEYVAGSARIGWLYGRVGARVRLGEKRRHEVGVDIGAWRGVSSDYEEGERTGSSRFTIPMGGVSYLYVF